MPQDVWHDSAYAEQHIIYMYYVRGRRLAYGSAIGAWIRYAF